jgi:DNA-binding IclR family transcriptional regulator
MVEVLSEWPLVSAPMAEEITGASRAALQRNLNDMAQMGLIREITGQGRYRVWCALV